LEFKSFHLHFDFLEIIRVNCSLRNLISVFVRWGVIGDLTHARIVKKELRCISKKRQQDVYFVILSISITRVHVSNTYAQMSHLLYLYKNNSLSII
jgi:hypothetical protein